MTKAGLADSNLVVVVCKIGRRIGHGFSHGSGPDHLVGG